MTPYLTFDEYNYNVCYKEKEWDDLPPPKDYEQEVKERKEIKFLTPNKLLTRLPILLAQTKAGDNSNKLKNKIRQILYVSFVSVQ